MRSLADEQPIDGSAQPGFVGPAETALQARRGPNRLFELIQTLILTVVLFVGIQAFVARPFKIEGGSMETTLEPGQYVLIDKLTPHWAPYGRGDIVVLDPPGSELGSDPDRTPFIKRVIGLPGDRIELRNGKVFVNGAVIEEAYIYADDGVRQPTEPNPGGLSEWLVPEGQLFVMGDHRQNSADSRTFGPIEIDHVIGRAWLRYWPFDTFGIMSPT